MEKKLDDNYTRMLRAIMNKSWGQHPTPSQLGLKNIPTALLLRGKTPPHVCPGYDIKQSNDEALVMRELWGIRSTPSLPSLSGPLKPSMVAPEMVLYMGQTELFDI